MFWIGLLGTHELTSVKTISTLCGIGLFITGLHWFLLLLVVNRWILKTLMCGVFIITSLTVYFMHTFNAYIDPSMIENIVNTDYHEARDLIQWRIITYVLFLGVLPSIVIWRMPIKPKSWLMSLGSRIIALIMAFTLSIGGLWFSYFSAGPILREKQELQYLVTPFNYLIAITKVYRQTRQLNANQKQIIGDDAHINPPITGNKPRLIIIVVGETVRASNWGLNGYARQTTPELTKYNVINFDQVSSCGTATAISVPCMFSPYGFHAYDQTLIKQSESLLHVLHHANISVLWRDNQSGCQGVCSGLAYEKLSDPRWCTNGECHDEILLDQLKNRIGSQSNNQLIVLHMMGNHGPAYFKRYPKDFNRWQPSCATHDFAQCTQESIINSYDNAILYTDHILGRLIDLLRTIQSHDAGLIYLSDHGESLGEHNIILHGLPYFIAPKEQKTIPMILWFSPGLVKQLRLETKCLAQKKSDKLSQDYLFSTVLALFNVTTKIYDPKYDLIRSCQRINKS